MRWTLSFQELRTTDWLGLCILQTLLHLPSDWRHTLALYSENVISFFREQVLLQYCFRRDSWIKLQFHKYLLPTYVVWFSQWTKPGVLHCYINGLQWITYSYTHVPVLSPSTLILYLVMWPASGKKSSALVMQAEPSWALINGAVSHT